MRPQLTSNEKLTLMVSGLALLVSVGASLYPILRDRRNDAERIVVSLTRRTDPYISQVFRAGETISQVTLEWKLLAANNGAIPVSIIDYRVWGELPDQHAYTPMKSAVFRADGARVSFPVVIEPGHAEGLVVRIGYWLPAEVERATRDALADVSQLPVQELEKRLAQRGRDLFGNPVMLS